jgi:hypothetical protein
VEKAAHDVHQHPDHLKPTLNLQGKSKANSAQGKTKKTVRKRHHHQSTSNQIRDVGKQRRLAVVLLLLTAQLDR